jgi:hypothetical protein
MRFVNLAGGLLASLTASLAFGAVVVSAAQASGPDEKFEKSLLKLDPSVRLEQLCDYTALKQIKADHKDFRPDRAVASAISEPLVKQDTVEAKAGAFRSRKKWYTMTYTCTATPDHMKVVAFTYAVGDEIPATKWAAYGLWD